jgi:hypothetical protein
LAIILIWIKYKNRREEIEKNGKEQIELEKIKKIKIKIKPDQSVQYDASGEKLSTPTATKTRTVKS